MSFSFAHSASSLQLTFRDLGLQGTGDETWGLDNVQVRVGALPFDQQRNAVCPPCQYHTPFPVNTRTGNYWTKVTDLQVDSPGVPIGWTRTYNSHAVGETSVLGAGWQHPYNARLITGAEAGRTIIQSPSGNRLRFDNPDAPDNPNPGQYTAWPGVNSTLTKNGSTYIQTLRDQSQYLFRDSDGMLTALRDPQGRQVDLVYNTTIPTQLDRIVDASNSARYLQLLYSGGRISSVADGARTVSYGYDASGNLTSVTDVRAQQTTYGYKTPANHLLTLIRNPLQQDVERIG